MSRVDTPVSAQPNVTATKITHDKIAKRAYEKWLQRGQQHGCDARDWLEAETELRAEASRTNSSMPARR